MTNGALLTEEDPNVPTTLTNGDICIARQGSTSPVFADMAYAGFAIGAGLTPQEESDLAAIMLRVWNTLK